MRYRAAKTGPAMLKMLAELDIPARRVTRRRKTGEYVADFFIPPDFDETITQKHAVLPAPVYASMVRERLPGAQITGVGEWKTDWRINPAEQVRYEVFVAFTVPESYTWSKSRS